MVYSLKAKDSRLSDYGMWQVQAQARFSVTLPPADNKLISLTDLHVVCTVIVLCLQDPW